MNSPSNPTSPLDLRASRNQPPILILIADDYPGAAEIMGEFLLDALDCEIIISGNGQQALEHAMARQPHTCLLDIHMPIMGGVECARALRSRWGPSPSLMIAISGEHSAEAHACGHFHHVLLKPPSMDHLLGLIRAW